MVEAGDNLDLECHISGEWNLCEWKKVGGGLKCLSYSNSDGELPCDGDDTAKVVISGDICKVNNKYSNDTKNVTSACKTKKTENIFSYMFQCKTLVMQ